MENAMQGIIEEIAAYNRQPGRQERNQEVVAVIFAEAEKEEPINDNGSY